MLRRLSQFSNVKVYDFREAKEITHDLNNYSDMIHHSPAVDRQVLALIAADKYRVNRGGARGLAAAAEGPDRGLSDRRGGAVALILRSGAFAASRRMSVNISWFETAQGRLLTMRGRCERNRRSSIYNRRLKPLVFS
jgi:hypothetical protein